MLPRDYRKSIRVGLDATLGYEYFIDATHPLAGHQGKVYYHRHVASIALGRWLRPEEVVHHVDEDRSNNAPENLKVCASTNEHSRLHGESRAPRRPRECKNCRALFDGGAQAQYCRPACAALARRRFTVSAEQLAKLVENEPVARIAERYGVSGTAVAKRCRRLGIPTRPRGYWAKNKQGSSK